MTAGGSPYLELIAPPPRTELTGGYRFNRRVADILDGRMYYHFDGTAARRPGDVRIVDSLWLTPGSACPPVSPRDILLAHSLPSLDPAAGPAGHAARAAAEETLVPKFRGAMAPSNFMAGILRERGLHRDRIRVVPPGVDGTGHGRKGGGTRGLHIVTVASWHHGKGLDTFPPLMESVRRLEWRWTIVGAPDQVGYRELVLADAVARGVRDRITLIDELQPDEVLGMLREADLFVLPTRMESFGMAIREAVSMGTPVLAGNCGGVPEALAGGGLALPVDDTRAWHDALGKALGDSAWLAELRARAAAAPRAPSWAEVAAGFARAVEELAG